MMFQVSTTSKNNDYTQIGPAFYLPQSVSVSSHFILIHYKQKPKESDAHISESRPTF